MAKFVIEKFYKGKSMGFAPESLFMRTEAYDTKEKAEDVCKYMQDEVSKITPYVKYKVKEIEA